MTMSISIAVLGMLVCSVVAFVAGFLVCRIVHDL